MRKFTIFILLLMTVFFVKTSDVQALTGEYTYDINSVDLITGTQGKTLRIKGWVYLNNYSNNDMHNIQPTYTLQLKGITSTGTQVVSNVYSNIGSKPSFSGRCATPNDYSKAWFTKGYGLYYPDPNTCGARAQAIIDSSRYSILNNHLAININFTFDVPLATFKGMSTKGVRKIYMYITASTDGKAKTVYGKQFNTQAVTKTIQVGIQSNRLSSSLKSQLATNNMRFQNPISQITSVVELGAGRPNANLDVKEYYYEYPTWRINRSSGTTLYYYNSKNDGDDKATYTVKGFTRLNSLNAAHEDVYSYKINVAVGGDCKTSVGTKRCLKDGGSTVAYIPGFWVQPIKGIYTYMEVTPNCDDIPACNPVTEACPTSCCTEKCKVTANKTTSYCTKTCNIAPPDVCTSLDPEKQYCCLHSSDPICQTPTCVGENCYSTPDPSANKTGTCKSSGVTNITFKYPSEGWGKTLLTNNACSISCQETLTAKFQPSQSVRAGMGFKYPVKINSSRYCTADYDNEGWQKKVADASTSANTAYTNMVNSVKSADTRDFSCGTSIILTKSNNCTNGYSLENGQCKKTTTSSPSCGGNCSGSGPTCSCSTSGYYIPATCPKFYPKCLRIYIPPFRYTTSSCSGGYSYSNGTCYHYDYKSACDSDYYLDGSICKKKVCVKQQSIAWSTAQGEIAGYLNTASSYRSLYNSYVSTVNRLVSERTTCDNYVANNQYKGAVNTKIGVNVPEQSSYTITSATSGEDTAYESARQTVWKKYSIYQCTNRTYDSQYLYGDYNSLARSFAGTYCDYKPVTQTYRDFWNKKSDANVDLEFSTDYYVQRYTGELSDHAANGYDHDGRYSYTDFYAPSGSNDFDLTAMTIGPNLPGVANNLWSIDPFTCQYNVNNLIFPPAGDPNNDKYGNVAFMYRQISLTDPFPGRNPGENWKTSRGIITSKGYKVYAEDPLYEINLTPGIMQDIRSYGTNYGSFYTNDPYRSILVEGYIRIGTIIKRK